MMPRLLLLTLVFASTVHADDRNEATGVAVGEKAPAFQLKDQAGKSTELDSLLKKDRMLAIVFHRSADW